MSNNTDIAARKINAIRRSAGKATLCDGAHAGGDVAMKYSAKALRNMVPKSQIRWLVGSYHVSDTMADVVAAIEPRCAVISHRIEGATAAERARFVRYCLACVRECHTINRVNYAVVVCGVSVKRARAIAKDWR